MQVKKSKEKKFTLYFIKIYRDLGATLIVKQKYQYIKTVI